MKKHTMQEWADWTGCNIVKDELGGIWLRDKVSGVIDNKYYDNSCYCRNGRSLNLLEFLSLADKDFLTNLRVRDPQVLVEPENKEEL